MYRLWEGLKSFVRGLVIFSVCWWLMVWAIGSWQTGRFLGLDDLMPTADRWMSIGNGKGR